MTKTKPSYTELSISALIERMERRVRRLENLVNEQMLYQPCHKPCDKLPDGFSEWWTKLDGFSAESKYIGDVSVYKSAALEIWKAALNWRKK